MQGRKSRYRSPDDVEKVVRENWAQGIAKFFITDDNFARNRLWEEIFDHGNSSSCARYLGIPLGLMIQVDTLCHKIPNFVEKAKRAGVTRVFIGLKNINPDSLERQEAANKITEYRKMLLDWKARSIATVDHPRPAVGHARRSIRRDISIIQRELPLDIVEFVILTPLPGCEDHRVLAQRGRHGSRPQQVRSLGTWSRIIPT